MKRNIIYALIITLIYACTDETGTMPTNDNVIRFAPSATSIATQTRSIPEAKTGNECFFAEVSSLNAEAQTRGTLADTIAGVDDFGVYAFRTAGAFSYSASITQMIMENMKVTVQHTNNEGCIYSPIKFWPDNTDCVTFMAYAPYLADAATTNENGLQLTEPTTSNNNISIAYTVPTEATNQPDLMVAELQKDKTTADDGAAKVPVNFQHALAAIGFKIRGNDLNIKEIKITNVVKEGTLTCYDGTNSDKFSWALGTTKADFKAGMAFDSGKDYATVGIDYKNVTAEDGYLMMIPQTLGDDIKLTISFDGATGGTNKTYQLSKTTTAWEAGKKYIYNITITPFYDIEVTPVNYDYAGRERSYTVTSRYIPEGEGGEIRFVPWELDASTIPDWINITTTSASSGDASTIYTTTAAHQENNPDCTSRNEDIQKQTPVSNFNLAEDGETANCYLVNAAGSYYFPANVMGVGDSGVDPAYARNYLGEQIFNASIPTNNAYAKLVWQTVNGLITNVTLDDDGNIHFNTLPQETICQGKALLAIVDKGADGIANGINDSIAVGDDKIMWSWQIWVTDISLERDIITFDFPDNTNTVLPYQLGFEDYGGYSPERKHTLVFNQVEEGKVCATCSVVFTQERYESYNNYICSYYKWGRKDPFIANKNGLPNGRQDLYDEEGNTLTFKFTTAANDFDVDQNFDITAPLRFAMSYPANWTPLIKGYADVWGDGIEKSIYDPSPPKFRIPRRGAFNGLTRIDYKNNKNFGYAIMNVSSNGQKTMNVPSCGGMYGRDLVKGLYYYGANNDCNYVWLSNPKNSSSATQNRLAYATIIANKPYGENTGQSSCHAYWVMPMKYKE